MFKVNNQTNPVMVGTITPINPSLAPSGNEVIRVAFIKLSLDLGKLTNGYDMAVTDYYYSTLNHKQITQSSVFPQESTLDQSYGPEQVVAYHDLGRFIVTNNADIFKGKVSWIKTEDR